MCVCLLFCPHNANAVKACSIGGFSIKQKEDASRVRDDNIPPYLKDNSFGSREDKAKSADYKYPHDYGGYVEQQYLPDSLKDRVYYVPGDKGYENTVREIRVRKGKKR